MKPKKLQKNTRRPKRLRPYRAPTLTVYGKLTELTAGALGSTGEHVPQGGGQGDKNKKHI